MKSVAMKSSLAAAGLSLLLLVGCASTHDNMQGSSAYLAPRLRLDLPAPADLGKSVEAVQMVTAHHAGQAVSFEAHISVTPERVLLVGVDPTGNRLMTVTWKGSQLAVERSRFLPKEVDPGAMLADLVTLYWPADIVRKALQQSGASLSVDSKSRAVTLKGKMVLHADYLADSDHPWQAGLRYHNYAWDYDIDVTSLQVTP